MVGPATGWFEISQIPEIDFNSRRVSQLISQLWLSRYPHPICCIYDNDSAFKKDFKYIIKEFGIKYRPTMVKNPQVSSIVKRVHGIINDILQTSDLNNHMFDSVDP